MDRPCPALQRLLEAPEESRVLGPYKLVSQLGRGGFAPVWLARETYGDKEFRTVAIKLFCVDEGPREGNALGREQIIDEARALCRVEHPNIVRFYNFQTDASGEVLGIVMEYARGDSVDRRLSRDGKLPLAEVLALGVSVASALAEIHKAGLVHRDVKPANVIDASGVYKLIDFGIAAGDRPHARSRRDAGATRIVLDDLPIDVKGTRLTALADTILSRAGASLGAGASEIPSGTFGYIDPECIATLSPATAVSDLYSLGALLFEAVTGTVPAAAAAIVAGRGGLKPEVVDGRERPPSLADVAPEAPAALVRLVDALLDPSAKNRPVSAAEVQRELAQLRAAEGPGEPTKRAAADAAQREAREAADARARTGRTGAIAAGGVVVATFVAIWFASRAGSATHPADAADAQPAATAVDAGAPAISADPLPPVVPLDEPPWGTAIADAQKRLAEGDPDGALAKLDAAKELGGGEIATEVRAQVAAVTSAPRGACTAVAIARPRIAYPPAAQDAGALGKREPPHVGRPSIAAVPGGAVVVWTDDHEQRGHPHAYSVMVDETGHPTSATRDLSPEGDIVYRPALLAVGDRVVLLYWDGAGAFAGVHVRWLRPDGRIAGPSVVVDRGRPANLWPALTKTLDGFVVAWQDDRANGNSDEVYLRKLDMDLQPVGDEALATATGAADASARTPSIARQGDRLLVTYVLEKEKTRVMKLRRFDLGAPDAGVDTRHRESNPVGLGPAQVAPDGPELACGLTDCFLVWHGAPQSAFAGQIDPEKRQLVWYKELTRRGGRPGIGQADSGQLAVAFYDAGLVKIASLSADGIGEASVVGKVSGDAAHPWVAPGREPGEWYVAWQATDGGEPWAARVRCR